MTPLKLSTVALFAVAVTSAAALILSSEVRFGNDTQKSGSAMIAAGDMAPPPDPEAVIAHELENATANGSNAALINFIARHRTHALADEARKRLDARNSAEAISGSAGPDASIYAEFDQARIQNTVAGYLGFIRRHPHHPLATEAKERINSVR